MVLRYYTNIEILYEFEKILGFLFCESTLKRFLVDHGIKRRVAIPDDHLRSIIEVDQTDQGYQSGYRMVHERVRNVLRLPVSQKQVMEILLDLNPDGTVERRSRRLVRR
jgi:hypothetical protein